MSDLEKFLQECEIEICCSQCEQVKKLLAMVRYVTHPSRHIHAFTLEQLNKIARGEAE